MPSKPLSDLQQSLKTPSRNWFIQVHACPIYVREWQLQLPEEAPLLMFVHGQGAHSHWWDLLAPRLGLACGMRAAALDLSGMGASGHRARYSLRRFAAELTAGIQSCRAGGKVIAVAHSFGGSVARTALHLQPDVFSFCVLLDSTFGRGKPLAAARQKAAANPRTYKSREEALKRFRLRPAQPFPDLQMREHIAGHSIKPANGGWQFKLDTRMRQKLIYEDFGEPLAQLQKARENYAVLLGGKSVFYDQGVADRLQAILPRGAVEVLPNAHHHLFLDQPHACCTRLAEMLQRQP